MIEIFRNLSKFIGHLGKDPNTVSTIFTVVVLLVFVFVLGWEIGKQILAIVIMWNRVTLQIIPGEEPNNLEENEKFMKFLHGLMQDYTIVTYEIAADGEQKAISFYMRVPARYAAPIKSRLFSAYRDIQVFEVEDYFPKKVKWNSLMTIHMRLKKDSILPIKRHSSILKQILSNMTDLQWPEKVYFQVILRKNQEWKKGALKRLKRKEKVKKPGLSKSKNNEMDKLVDVIASQIDYSENSGDIRKGRVERTEINESASKLREVGFEVTINIAGVYARSRAKGIASNFHELNDENIFRSRVLWVARKSHFKKMKNRIPRRYVLW